MLACLEEPTVPLSAFEPQDWVLQVPAHETLWATLVYALPEVWVINATAQSVVPCATIGY